MQLSDLQHWSPTPPFLDHKQNSSHITLNSGAGQLWTNSSMGKSQSIFDRDKFNSINSHDMSIQIREETQQPGELSRPDSRSLHYDYTDQAQYACNKDENAMISATSQLTLPTSNASHALAHFLRTTGPPTPHRRPSKIGQPKLPVTTPKYPFRLFKRKHRGPNESNTKANDDLNLVLRDEGGLLDDTKFPGLVQQKQTSTAKRYSALQVKKSSPDKEKEMKKSFGQHHNVFDSRVSISVAEDMHSSDALDAWLLTFSKENSCWNRLTSPRNSSPHLQFRDEHTEQFFGKSSLTIRSNQPTPQQNPAVSVANSCMSNLIEHAANRTFNTGQALTSNSINSDSSITALPQIPLSHEEFPVRLPISEKEVEIKHPSPRRFASHPVLLQRASSIASTLYPRSVSDSPGPPPPRSPLRLRRDPRTIESIISSHTPGKIVPKSAPIIKPVQEFNDEMMPIKATVVTDCTGPIKRPKDRLRNLANSSHVPSRREHEERLRARKLRDRACPAQILDCVANTHPPSQQRLAKVRPHVESLQPAPLATRASSSASSDASWKKLSQFTKTPISPVPSQNSKAGDEEKIHCSPMSASSSRTSAEAVASLSMSPVVLIAEEVPMSKAKHPSRPAQLILKEARSYAPRPRSASIPRSTLKRRGRNTLQTPVLRTLSVAVNTSQTDDNPNASALPSSRPNRALPPTPPASGSEKPGKLKNFEFKKELSALPAYEIHAEDKSPPKLNETIPHVATQARRTTSRDKKARREIDARLEALEKQNAILSAALIAVLKTNCAFNGHHTPSPEPDSQNPMGWENRVARRSAASQSANCNASSSNESALEVYMSTRHGSLGAG